MIEAVCGIYKIQNTVNNKIYVGQSTNIKERWRQHKKDCRAGKVSYLYKSMRKHGIDKFEISILELCESNCLDEREAYWMSFYNCHDENCGYNFRPAGQNKQHVTPEARKRISERLKGRKLPAEQIEKMRIASTGRPCTEEAKKKLSAFHKDKILEKEVADEIKKEIAQKYPKKEKEKKRTLNTDSYKTEEFKKKTSDRFLGKPKSPEHREKIANALKNQDPIVKAHRLEALRAVTKARWDKWRAEKQLKEALCS